MLTKTWREAATLIIAVRSQAESYKILMLKRSSGSRFMPNAYVFPGGVKSEADFSSNWNTVLKDFPISWQINYIKDSKTEIKSNHDLPVQYGLAPEIGFRLCALRETFEESGILIASDDKGKEIVLSNPNEHIGGEFSTLQGWRSSVYKDPSNFLKLFHSLNLSPAVASLIEWSTWLSPTFEKSRFKAIFYLCCIDNTGTLSEEEVNQDSAPCGEEMTEISWKNTADSLNGLKSNFPPPQVTEVLRLNRKVDLSPNIGSLYKWSRWLTPSFLDKRFDTHFYISFLSEIPQQTEDNFEMVKSDWLTPIVALHRHVNDKILLRVPQIYELNRMNIYPSLDGLKKFAMQRESKGLDMWCPHKIFLKDGSLIAYPKDDFHNTDPNAKSSEMKHVTLEEIRHKSSSLNRIEFHENGSVNLYDNMDWFGHKALGHINLDEFRTLRELCIADEGDTGRNKVVRSR